MPLEAAKNFEGVPLISTGKLAEVRNPIIQFIASRGTPIWIRMSCMKDEFT